MAKQELIILVGNIGEGKTILAKEYVKDGYINIARDSLRYSIGAGEYIYRPDYESIIFKTERYMLGRFLALGENVIIDSVGMSKRLRKIYIIFGRKYNYNIKAIVMPKLSMEEAVNRRLKDPHGQYSKKLWEKVWSQFDKIYEEPTKKEGFNSITKL